VGGLTDRDTAFAGELDKLIDEMELKRQPKKISRSHLIFVTPNIDAIKPFWKAVFYFKEAEGSGQTDRLVDRSDVLGPIRCVPRPSPICPSLDLMCLAQSGPCNGRIARSLSTPSPPPMARSVCLWMFLFQPNSL